MLLGSGTTAREESTLNIRALAWCLVCVMVWCLMAPSSARAATYDPDLTWRTIVTEHFRVHFHQGEEQLAEEFSHMVEEVYDTMTAEMQWTPRMKTEVVLIDRTDRANGFATAVPYNAITIFVTAPQEDSTLSLYEDWSEAIFTHELTHVLHMETNRGIVRAARAVVGRIASTNDVSPWWMVEGLATLQETRHTPGGRGRSPFVDMIKRAAVVDDAFPPLGNLDGLQVTPPSGNLRYLFGQDFMQYVADNTGRDAWTRWTHTYGGHIPFLLPTKKTFGRKLHGLYYDWRTSVFERYRAQLGEVEREGVREGIVISTSEDSCSAPSFSPDNTRIVWSCYDLQMGSSIWSSEPDGSGAEKLIQDFGARTFTWRADGQAFVYAASHIVNRFNTWSDVYMFDLRRRRVTALTQGARARDPDFSPDGTHLMMVTNRVQNNQLETLTVDQRRKRLTNHTDHTQYSTPRYHPSGELLAVSVWEHGRRDLWLIAPDGTRLRRLTFDAANDRDPSWSTDGRYLFFSSDRSGIPNIYALELETLHLWQVTNVRTGAARPSVSPDFQRLAYEQYSANGWDVRLMTLDPADWLDRGTLPSPITGGADAWALVQDAEPVAMLDSGADWTGEPLGRFAKQAPESPGHDHGSRPQDAESIDTFEQTEVADVFGDESDYPFTIKPRRYNPWPSLIPRYWLPSFGLTQRLAGIAPSGPFSFLQDLPAPLNIPGLSMTASTGASDPLRHYAWSAFFRYRTDANAVGGGGSFTINRWLPVFSFGFSTNVVVRPYRIVDREATAAASDGSVALVPGSLNYFERRMNASASLSYPFTPRSTVFANYNFSSRQAVSGFHPDVEPTTIPLRGSIGRVSAGYRYSWSQQTPTAISREDARTFSFVGSLVAPWLGSFARVGDIRASPYTLDIPAETSNATGLGDQVVAPFLRGPATNGDLQRVGVYQFQLSAELREYLVMPWAANHVLAMRGAAGVSFGSGTFIGNYTLGGNLGDSAFYVRPAEYRMIRGYRFSSDTGDNYWLLGAEYRFPIWRLDRGVGTLPAFARALSGAVFVDSGNAFNELGSFAEVFDTALVGVGAELRLSTVLFWSGGFDFRFGYATGLTQNGIRPLDAETLYIRLGGAF
jgi:hypothetical protein